VLHKLPVLLIVFFLLSITVRPQQSFSPEQFAADFDFMWSSLRDNYVYFDKKETDWNRVRELYRPMLARVKSRSDFVTLLERVLDELYDNHLSLYHQPVASLRLQVSTPWAEWRAFAAVITQLRKGFSAEQAGFGLMKSFQHRRARGNSRSPAAEIVKDHKCGSQKLGFESGPRRHP
jgi:carboxyl-terminal processing protease